MIHMKRQDVFSSKDKSKKISVICCIFIWRFMGKILYLLQLELCVEILYNCRRETT